MLMKSLLVLIWAAMVAVLYLGLKARLRLWEPRWWPAAVVASVTILLLSLGAVRFVNRPIDDAGCPTNDPDCAPAHVTQE
jgi:hypothetical protein